MTGSRRWLSRLFSFALVLVALALPVMEAMARGRGGGGARGGGGFSRGGGGARGGGYSRGGSGGFDRGSFQPSHRPSQRPSGGRDLSGYERSRLPPGTADRGRIDRPGASQRPAGLGDGERRQGAEQRMQDRRDDFSDRQGDRQQAAADRQGDRQQQQEDRQAWRDQNREDWQSYARERQEDREDFWEDNYGWGWGPYYSTASFWSGMFLGSLIVSLPPNYETLYVSGEPYYYYNGVYYRKKGAGWVVVEAPVGVTVTVLPDESAPVYVEGGAPLEYANGTFYESQPADESGSGGALHTVVKAPPGVTVPQLPSGAEEKTVGDITYFVHGGTWYQPFYSGSAVVYMVVEEPAAAPSA